MLRWIEAEDPALASAPQRPPETRRRMPPRTAHVPSYLLYHPTLKHFASAPIPLRTPELNPPGPVPSAPPRPATSLGKIASRIIFSDELAGAGQFSLPAMDFTITSKAAPEAVRFRVGLGSDGFIHYAFPLNSSGDPDLDQQARRYLNLVRFSEKNDSAAPRETIWGIATMHWGNDLTLVSASRSRPRGEPGQTASPK